MKLRDLFTHTEEVVYFNHASSAPLPLPTREKMKKLVDELAFGDKPWDFWTAELAAFRERSARLLGAQPSEIGYIPNTSLGLIVAIYSIPWDEGDNIIVMKNSFPANAVPWVRNLKWMQRKEIDIEGEGPLEERIMAAIDSSTRAVAVDWVDFFSGYRLDLAQLGEFCSSRGIFLVVDGVQGAGAVSLDLSKVNVDFFSAGSAKWLLGPVGAGALYVNENTLPKLRPAFEGWMSLDWQDFNIFSPLPPIKLGAARFEPGSYPGVPLVGFNENLKILNSVDIQEIDRKVFELRKILLDGLLGMDAEIISTQDEAHASGILTFRLPGVESRALYDALTRDKVVCSLRKNAIRLSPHFYNTSEEAEMVLEVVRRFAKPS